MTRSFLRLPPHPVLVPGVVVARRTDGFVQVGSGLPARVALPDTPEVRALLHDLGTGRPLDPDALPPAAMSACIRLLDAGLLVDGTVLFRTGDATAASAPVIALPARAALLAQHPRTAAAIVDRRRAGTVVVSGPEEEARLARDLLRHCGLTPSVESPPDRSLDSRATAALLIARGEVARGRVDALMASGTCHVAVRLGPGVVEVGPLVVPGETACLRCIDAADARLDPQRPLVVAQHEDRPASRADGVPHPLDPALTTMAVAWAVRDLVSWIDGVTPSLWSTTVRLDPTLGLERTRWQQDQWCGCAWDQRAAG